MKKMALIGLSTLAGIAVVAILMAGGDYSKSGRYSEYDRLLKIALNNDKNLTKHFDKGQTVLNSSNDAKNSLDRLLNKKTQYYNTITDLANSIQDTTLKVALLQKVNSSKRQFEAKIQPAASVKKQLEILIQEQRDLNTILSVLATLPLEQEDEKQIKPKIDALKEANDDFKAVNKDGLRMVRTEMIQ